MANIDFQVFKDSDQNLINAFQKIAANIGALEKATLSMTLANGYPAMNIALDSIDTDASLKKILDSKSSMIWKLTLRLPALNSNITVERHEGTDKAIINLHDQLAADRAVELILSVHQNLRTYDRTENIDKLLGNELAEFYRRREQGLLRLEELAQKLIQQNEEYRTTLDTQHLKQKDKLEKENEETKTRLLTEVNEQNKKLTEKEHALEQRTKELDDRSSKHARRQIRKDLKDELAIRSKEFTLTIKTAAKRMPVHAIFIVMLSIFGVFILLAFKEESTDILYKAIRIGLSSVAFAATAIFYIRWNDHWFRQHADEEFRLKRFELDIDRASWVVEMALEWKDEKGTEIPKELIERLTRGLFLDQKDANIPKHPSEDLANALLSASAGLTLRIPGVGEATIDKKGIQKFKKAALETEKSKEE